MPSLNRDVTRTEDITDDHCVSAREGQIVFAAAVRQVQVVGVRRPFRGHRVDLLHERIQRWSTKQTNKQTKGKSRQWTRHERGHEEKGIL